MDRSDPLPVERLYLDFDSFFASAEQHFNPALRGKPVGVVPLDSLHTGCIAVSREAKQLGVKSNASIRDARAQVPNMIFVVARHDVYVRLHKRIVEVIETCLPVTHVRSIDEVVCDLLPSEAKQGAALAQRIKDTLARTFSEVLTCSIGMAPTELLAKIAAEADKPDGFNMIEPANIPSFLSRITLDDIPGVSDGMIRRLKAAGVEHTSGLWHMQPKEARAIWGNVDGERFWHALHGLHSERPETTKRMFGHSRMLPREWRSPGKVADCAKMLMAGASRRLRRTDLRASKMTLSMRGGGHRSAKTRKPDHLRWSYQISFAPSRDDHAFMAALTQGLEAASREVSFVPRSVSVMLHGLIAQQALTGDLFDAVADHDGEPTQAERREKWEPVSTLVDNLRAKYGPDAISMGPQSQLPGGYLGAKIAFGRIPDAADFGAEPVADEATHFLSA